MFLFSTLSWGQTQYADGDYRSAATGNWNTAATWQVRSSGSWATASTLPTASTNVFIQNSHNITLNVSVLASDGICNNLHINVLGVLAISGANNVQVNGKIRAWSGTAVITTGAGDFIDASSTATASTMITTSSTGVLKFVGTTRNITNSGEWNSSGTNNFAEFALNSGQIGTLNAGVKFKITFSSGIITTSQNISLSSGNCTIKSGARLISSRSGTTSEVLGNSSTLPAGTVTIDSGGILELTGALPAISCNTFTNNGTVIYSKSGVQTLLQSGTLSGGANNGTGVYTTYNNLILSGSSPKTLFANTTIAANGSLSIQGTATLALNTFSLSYGTNTTLEYARTSSTTVDVEWPSTNSPANVSVNSSSNVSFNNASATAVLRTITGTFSLSNTGSFTVDDNSGGGGGPANTSNVLTFANGSTIIRTGGSLNLSGGVYLFGSSSTDVVNLTINGNGLTSTSEFASGATNPGRYGVLTITSGNTYTLSSSGKVVNNLVLNGNIVDGGAILTVRGNITGTGNHSGTGKILMSGNATSSSISEATFGNLDLNDSDGFSLSGSPIVDGVLSLTAGIVATSTNTLTITAAGSVTRTAGWVNGNLKKYIPTAATTATFEIGDASNYTPLTTAFTGTISAATGNITASTTVGDHSQIATSGLYSNKTVNRIWTLTNDIAIPGLTSYSPTFTFVSSDIDSGATTSNFVVRNYNSSAWNGPTTGTQNATSSQATGVTTFGDFAIGELKVPVISTSGSLLAFTTTVGNPSVAQSITISGADMNAGILVTPPVGFEVATSSDFTTTIGTSTSPITIGASGTINSTPIYVRMDSSTTVASSPYSGDLSLSSSGASTNTISIPSSTVTANAVPSILLSTTALTAFPKIAAASKSVTSQNFVIGGLNLGSNAITITPPTNFKISETDVDANYTSSPIVLTPSSGTVANTTIYVKYSPTGTGNISGNTGNIDITNDSVSPQTVSVTGNGLNRFYYNANSITATSNWKALPNGTGDNPTNFSTDGITYKILNNAATDAPWTVSGSGSKVILGDSSASPVTFTIADTFPLTGTIDITAASVGSNSLILNNNETVTSPVTPSPLIFGTLDATSEVHFRSLITVSGSYTFGKVFVDGGSFVNFPSFSGSHRILTSLEVAQNSLMFGSGTANNYLNCSGALVTINGTLRTTRTSGFTNNSITPGSTYGVIQFSGSDAITLGVTSTIEYSRDTSGSTQFITPRTDYKNVLISGADNIKTLSGTTTITGIFTVNGTGTSSLITGNNNLTLSTAASAVFGPGSVLNISGGTTDFGGRPVTLKSTSAGTARIATILGTLSGATNVTVERYIPAKRAWRALTAPLKGTNASVFSQWQNNGTVTAGTGVELWGPEGVGTPTSSNTGLATGPSNSILQYDNNTGTWSPVTNTNTTYLFATLSNNAFMVFPTGAYGSGLISGTTTPVATTLKATGQLVTGNISYTGLPSTNHTLIGNPYASPLSPNLLLAGNTNFGNNLWIWDANASGTYGVGAYNSYDKLANTYTNVTNSAVFSSTPDIQSGQAFFVKANTGTPTLTISESFKSSTTPTNIFLRDAAPAEVLRVGLYKQTNSLWTGRDGAMAVFLSDAEVNPTSNKMANGSENIAFTKNGTLFASEHHLPLVASDVLNVRVWNTTPGANYKLKINTEQFTTSNLNATLEDVFTNSRTALTLDGTAVEYPFAVTTEAASTGNRFRIVFENSALGITNPKANGISILPNPITGDTFQVYLGTLGMGTYSYSICNALGQEVEKGSINNTTQNTSYSVKFKNSTAAGMYIMKVIGEDNTVFSAKIIKQ